MGGRVEMGLRGNDTDLEQLRRRPDRVKKFGFHYMHSPQTTDRASTPKMANLQVGYMYLRPQNAPWDVSQTDAHQLAKLRPPSAGAGGA